MIRKRRGVLVGTGAIALAMVVTSAAWACTVFYGNLTVSGNGTGSVNQTIAGDPGDGFNFMDWCPAVPTHGTSGNGWNENAKAAFWTVRTDNANPLLSMSVAPSEDCDAEVANQLPEGTYTVTHRQGYMDVGGSPHHNCHGTTGDVVDGSFNVASDGTGSGGPYDLDATSSPNPGWHSICIWLPDPEMTGFAPANALNFKNI